MRLILKDGRERALARRHPWILSGAVDRVEGAPVAGDVLVVQAANGARLAVAAWSPQSQIRGRVLSFDAAVRIDEAFVRARISAAIAARRLWPGLSQANGGERLVHAEADGLPGVIVDRYADTVVIQLLTAWADRQRDVIAGALVAATGCARVYERSDADVRALEGLDPRAGVVSGDEPPECVVIAEPGTPDRRYGIDVRTGQKTGFFLDQRDNRTLVAALAGGRDVLDAFCYSGGFAIAAATGGAKSVLAIDSSAAALGAARANATIDPRCGGIEWREADVFAELRRLRDRGSRFDLIVLDPPKLAPTAKHVERASRAYKDANLLGFKLLRPGGLLVTFSCSGGVGPELFQKIVAGAALDAGVDAQVLRSLGASPDHLVALAFPESAYLKGLVCRVAA